MKKQFDFGNIADEYDKYYESDFGIQVDKIEKLMIKKYLQRLISKNILEIGCGTGHWSQYFSKLGFQINGIDISDKMLGIAKTKNIKNAIFSNKNIEQLDLESNSVDNVVAVTSLEFVENFDIAISEINRVLKPNGYFICAGLNLNSDLGKNKSSDEIYRSANFFTDKILNLTLSKFGVPEISAGVVIENGEFCDQKYSEHQKLYKGLFLVAIVKKTK